MGAGGGEGGQGEARDFGRGVHIDLFETYALTPSTACARIRLLFDCA